MGTPVLARDPNIARELPPLWNQPVDDASLEALAVSLQKLPALFPGGDIAHLRGTSSQFSQRKLTARLISIYQDVRDAHYAQQESSRAELSAA